MPILLLLSLLLSLFPSQLNAVPQQEDPIYEVVDIRPVPEGGQQAALITIVKNLRYPSYALEKKVEGLVAVEFVVEKDGSISQLAIIKGIGYGCDEEAMRVVALLKKWSPGILNGAPVRTRMRFPVKFKLG
jgi:periplasmic protein TonB